jgi:hypothetical protein
MSITLMTSGLAAVLAAAAMAVLSSAGRGDWALGVMAGWAAGSVNTALLARRVSRLTDQSSVAGFLYGTGSRFALIALMAIGAYRLVDANPLGFAMGIALVVLMGVPVSVIWSLRQEAVG